VAGLSAGSGDRRRRVLDALAAVEEHLNGLLARALEGLAGIKSVRVLGAARRRTSTISFVIEGVAPQVAAQALAHRGISVWHGDNYAYELMHRFGLRESGGAVRASIVLYNDHHDVDRLLDAVAEVAAG